MRVWWLILFGILAAAELVVKKAKDMVEEKAFPKPKDDDDE